MSPQPIFTGIITGMLICLLVINIKTYALRQESNRLMERTISLQQQIKAKLDALEPRP